MNPPLSPGQRAQVACILEATARKPGNVHRTRDFDDSTYLDFLLSASAIAGPLDRAPGRPVGETILEAVRATRRVVPSNTNLGMILLMAPLAAVPAGEDLRSGVTRVLDHLGIEDARLAFEAIRLARPGGLGTADEQDVNREPSATLLEAMKLAADRDLIARQYANGYADLFDVALPSLQFHLKRMPLEDAIVAAYLSFLARTPDTLILRKRGPVIAIETSGRAAEALESGDLAGFDRWLREDGHARNPGATADLIAATLFAALSDGTIGPPFTLAPP